MSQGKCTNKMGPNCVFGSIQPKKVGARYPVYTALLSMTSKHY